MNMHHPPTSAELLDNALGHQAPHLVDQIAEQLGGDVVAQLAHAVDRRVYIERRHVEDEIVQVFDEAAARIRARYDHAQASSRRLVEQAAADVDEAIAELDATTAALVEAQTTAALDADENLTEAERIQLEEFAAGRLATPGYPVG